MIRILFVGTLFFQSQQADIEFSDSLSEAPSLFDFDAVVVHPSHTWSRADRKELTPWHFAQRPNIDEYTEVLNRKKIEANHLLGNGGLIVSFLDPVEAVTYDGTQKFANYDWIPIKDLARLVKEGTGRRIKIAKRSPFDSYLKLPDTAFGAHLERNASYEALALNEAGYVVAAQSKIGTGSIFLLPGTTFREGYETLIGCLSGVLNPQVERETPVWISDFVVPEEVDTVRKLRGINEQIHTLKTDEENITRKLSEITGVKRLLYEQGEPLENAVRMALSELGLPATKVGDIDLVTLDAQEPLIIEITGSESQIGIDKFRQLLNYVMDEQEKGRAIPKSILIANHQISIPPEKRASPFTDKAIEQSKVFHSCLLPTVELFKAVLLFREGKLDQTRFSNALMKTDGVFALSRLVGAESPMLASVS